MGDCLENFLAVARCALVAADRPVRVLGVEVRRVARDAINGCAAGLIEGSPYIRLHENEHVFQDFNSARLR